MNTTITINLRSDFPVESSIWSPEESRYAFAAIPGNATVSTVNIIVRSRRRKFVTPRPLNDFQDAIDWQAWSPQLFTFAIIRDPYLRLLTYWRKLHHESSFTRWVLAGFPDFVLQTEYIDELRRQGVRIDIFLRLENLEEDWQEIYTRTGLYWPPHFGSSQLLTEQDHEQEIMQIRNDAIFQLVQEKLRPATERLSYGKENPQSILYKLHNV